MCFAASPSSCVFRAQLRQCSAVWFMLLQTFKQPFIFLQEVDFQGGFDSQLTERVGAKLFFEKQTADIYCADSHNILAACAPCGNLFTTIIYKTQTLSPSSHYPRRLADATWRCTQWCCSGARRSAPRTCWRAHGPTARGANTQRGTGCCTYNSDPATSCCNKP